MAENAENLNEANEPNERERAAREMAEMAEMAGYRRTWRDGLKRKSLATLDGEYEWFEELVLRHPYHLDEDEKILEELHHAIATLEARAVALGKADCPIAFFQPSWEQAQCMLS